MTLEQILIVFLIIAMVCQQFVLHAYKLWMHEAHELLLEHEQLLRPTDPRRRMMRKIP